MNIEDIDAMLEVQKHRGPDDFGVASYGMLSRQFFTAKNTADLVCDDDICGVIGHNRLSILDLSELGHQPMISSDGMVAIVYNGEVYNAFDYKDELVKEGFVFKSETDTEVILNLYIKYGIDKTLQLLNGMFAFCIIDLSKQKIIWARDRVGIKPLYYYDSEDEFVFASEVKSLIKRKSVKRKIDLNAVEEYFSFRSTSIDSLLDGVYQVKPGEYLEMDSESNIRKVKWFDINDYSRSKKVKANYTDLINQAVNSQMISDVKVGCQLSGGIDSSLVSYFARNTGYEDAVSIVFDDERYSEEKYMDHVTSTLNIHGHKKTLDIDYIIENWERMNWHMDAVVNHPNTMGIMALAEESKKYVTVLLSGEGADETAGGYANFVLAHLVDLNEKIPVFSPVLKKIYKGKKSDYRRENTDLYIKSHGYTQAENVEKVMLQRGDGRYLNARRKRIEEYTGNAFDRMGKYDFEFYLPELLMRQDKMTMALSIENRVPLLDNTLIDYLYQCDERLLVGWKMPHDTSLSVNNLMVGKKIMKKLSIKVFGKKFTYRRKSGFPLPIKEFFADERFRSYVNEKLLPSMQSRGIINTEYVKNAMDNLEKISRDDAELLWRIFSFETWCQLFIDGREVQKIA